jgi:nanoRNase/pAp phosphatase (c-di-AMP/oligoRNAs hydrolase)
MRGVETAPPTPARRKTRQLEIELRNLSQGTLVILLSGHPDPDAIGSALAHKRICRNCGIDATIAHVLPISRPENQALVELLDIELLRVRGAQDLQRFSYVSLVDTSSVEATIQLPWGLRLVTVVDHHRAAVESTPTFVDIRPWAGATSTIYAEYAEFGTWPLRRDVADDTRVATALLFGIRSDSDDFALAGAADFRAAAYLRPFCDNAVLDKLRRRVVTTQTMNVLGRALLDLTLVRDFAMAGVGRVDPVHRDAIPAAADFILQHERVETVLVYGVVGDRIDGSLRTHNPRLDCSHFLHSAFGADESGKSYGGGRWRKGGFQIPLHQLRLVGDDVATWPAVQRIVAEGLTRAVSEVEYCQESGEPPLPGALGQNGTSGSK